MAQEERKNKPLTLDDLVITTKTESTNQRNNRNAEGTNTILNIGQHESQGQQQEQELTLLPATPVPSSLPITLTRSYRITPGDVGISSGGNGDENVSSVADSIQIECLVQVFGDSVFMGISQNKGKIGNYVLCQAEPNPTRHNSHEFEVTNLLGMRDDPLLAVYAKRLAEMILQVSSLPMQSLTLVLGLSFQSNSNKGNDDDGNKGRDPEVFRLTVDVMSKLYQEALSYRSG